MKRITTVGVIGILACSLTAAYAGPKDDILAAAKKLAQNSYTWTTTMDLGANSNFRPGPMEGKHAADGTTYISREFNGNTFESYHKGDKTVFKRNDEWQVVERGAGQGAARRGRGGFFGAPAPTTQIENVLKETQDFKESGGALVADLTEAGAKSMLTFGGRGRGGENPPEPKGAKGSLKVWLKDGQLVKYALNVKGTVTGRNGEERDVDRTTTVEFKDVGATKLEVPQEVKEKL